MCGLKNVMFGAVISRIEFVESECNPDDDGGIFPQYVDVGDSIISLCISISF